MTSAQRTTVAAAACLVVSMTAIVLLLRHLDTIRPKATIEDVLYINSPKVVRRASLGFDGLAACLYWTRTVQSPAAATTGLKALRTFGPSRRISRSWACAPARPTHAARTRTMVFSFVMVLVSLW